MLFFTISDIIIVGDKNGYRIRATFKKRITKTK